jgi:hypothetical protein
MSEVSGAIAPTPRWWGLKALPPKTIEFPAMALIVPGMGKNKSSSSSKIVGFLLLLPVFALLAWLAPIFFPIWRWTSLDFKAIADKNHIKLSDLTKEYTFSARYHPRAAKDPVPFQLFEMQPNWADTEGHRDEDHLEVRVVFISDLTGTGPNEAYIGDNPKGQYFKGQCWRLPKGSIPGVNKFHPIIVYQGASTPMTNAEVVYWDFQLGTNGWKNDDDDVDDGFKVPDAPSN